MKRIFKVITVCLLSFIVFSAIVALVVWRNVATGHDLEVTNAIRQDVEKSMGTDFSRLAVVVSPSRAQSSIIVHGALSEQEKDKLAAMAAEISRRHDNWHIRIVYE